MSTLFEKPTKPTYVDKNLIATKQLVKLPAGDFRNRFDAENNRRLYYGDNENKTGIPVKIWDKYKKSAKQIIKVYGIANRTLLEVYIFGTYDRPQCAIKTPIGNTYGFAYDNLSALCATCEKLGITFEYRKFEGRKAYDLAIGIAAKFGTVKSYDIETLH